jgi:multiple sugar transport system substrate-binding protein
MSRNASFSINRRQFLKGTGLTLGLAAVAPLLAACGNPPAAPATSPPATPQVVTKEVTSVVTQVVEKQVTSVVTQVVEKPVQIEVTSTPAPTTGVQWTAGKTPATNADQFYIMSWEGKGKIEKWQLGVLTFFQAYYPKIKLQFDWGIPWGEYWTKLPTILAGGAPLDMCWMHDTRGPTLSSQGALLAMDDFFKQLPVPGWPQEYYPSQVKAFNYMGKQYALPYDWAPGAFYVNADMLQKAGVDIPTEKWTFDDLLAAAQKMTNNSTDPKQRTWGVILPTGSGSTYWITRNFNGNQVDGEPPASHFNEPGTIAAYQYLYDLMWKHKVMPTPEERQFVGGGDWEAFASGKVGLVYALNDASNSVAQAVGKKFTITAAPTPKGVADRRVQFVGGSAFSVPAKSPHPDVAYELCRWIVGNKDLLPKIGAMDAGGTFVSNSTVWESGLPPKSTNISQDAFKKAFYDLGLQDGIEPNYFVGFLQWDPEIYTKNTDLLWNGAEKDIAKVMNKIHADTQQLLATMKQ